MEIYGRLWKELRHDNYCQIDLILIKENVYHKIDKDTYFVKLQLKKIHKTEKRLVTFCKSNRDS